MYRFFRFGAFASLRRLPMFLLSCSLLFSAQLAVQEPADFPAKLQSRARMATVRVLCPAKKSEGSGVIVGRTGGFVYVLTANHIVEGADMVEIAAFSQKNEQSLHRNCRIVAKGAGLRDLALIRMEADEKETFSILPVCPVESVPKTDGFPALALGCSEGREPTAIVCGALRKKNVRRNGEAGAVYLWEAPDAVAKGRSGGPIIDGRGLVLGICSGTNDGKGYYTHIHDLHRFLKQNGFDWLAEKQGTPSD
jgi:S1-C subfamily serine protease